ncbi:SigE family RNA polymerase sigma factor [Kribbella sp. NPDC051586]|uniref:SigE family RNA polymerase sigma factor n=1 Tax=Kribbella sp. NPDC051586 TaxID=3364118 RepID=UPI0037AFF93B
MRRRDEAEFTEFAAMAVRRLRRTAYLMCGDWHRAEDAAQDALVKVYRRWNWINRHDNLPAYANRVVVNTILDQSRRVWRQREFLDGEGAAIESVPLAPDQIDAIDDRDMVFEVLALLPPAQRACIVLRHYSDLSVEQTAEALGIGTGAVKSQTSRGLARLRELLSQRERCTS